MSDRYCIWCDQPMDGPGVGINGDYCSYGCENARDEDFDLWQGAQQDREEDALHNHEVDDDEPESFRDDEGDGQPDELTEWLDFDPDC